MADKVIKITPDVSNKITAVLQSQEVGRLMMQIVQPVIEARMEGKSAKKVTEIEEAAEPLRKKLDAVIENRIDTQYAPVAKMYADNNIILTIEQSVAVGKLAADEEFVKELGMAGLRARIDGSDANLGKAENLRMKAHGRVIDAVDARYRNDPQVIRAVLQDADKFILELVNDFEAQRTQNMKAREQKPVSPTELRQQCAAGKDIDIPRLV